MGIGEIWDLIILSPLINVLIVLSDYLFNSLGLTIIVLTIVVRALMYPLTQKQLQASKAMQSIQAEVAELRKKYAKDRQRLAQEQMKLYKQSGMNPAGCMLPMLVQMPVWIALYQAIIRVLAVAPEGFLSLSRHLYSSWPMVFSLVPLESRFLWMDLAASYNLLLAILVGGTMWVQQKMMTVPTPDPKQQQQSQMMLWMMPLMFGYLTFTFPSGLALYWVTSNVISIVAQYFVTGWGGLVKTTAEKKVTVDKKIGGRVARQKAPLSEADIGADIMVEPSSAQGEGLSDERKSGDTGTDRRRSYTASPRATRRKSRRGKDYRSKRR